MAVLSTGSGIDRDLTLIGVLFRETLGDLTFDRFAIDVVNLSGGSTIKANHDQPVRTPDG